MGYQFYGWQEADKVKAEKEIYKGIQTPIDLYEKLQKVWCADSCAPRMRDDWTPANNTLGQCSITAFLAQDIFGGNVYGMKTSSGGIHCYNEVDGILFDLTSEQFGEKARDLIYDMTDLQDRESAYHFQKEEKRARYEYIKSRLDKKVEGHLYFVRHGQTVWNVEDKICGATDSPLTEKGRMQAKEVAEQILKEGIHIDKIIYSPLSRARDTAMEISGVIGVPAVMEPLLIEQNFGKWEGTSPRNAAEFMEAKGCFAQNYEGGESMLRLCQRIYNLIDRIKMDSEQVYLLVAHNGISRTVESYFRDMTNEEYASFGVKNCEIRRYDF